MRIDFEDNSFIMIDADTNPELMLLVMCGKKDGNKLTMSSSKLTKEQIKEICEFLAAWLKKT